ncbi:MAG: isoprenyl transferase [Flavobacteriales bacterium]|nr:MAG: isoprenyl transferase [Flavobacteriales bacterium]CAI8325508.1 MAG: Ditrans,polycis-undecaprenyl-diphosphate synthase ((2E,6E)-farnesyl-diphosphate specific) [Flavobacteriales bacterium]|tara:strand:+ start:3237 stop:3947 length:711 start_codon:yes stop_codon:yes gene_type:complete
MIIPKHTAIIMDGNGRWAEQKGMPRIFGHQNGVEAVRKIVESANHHKIEYLTLFTFSLENWNRPVNEVETLMSLLVNTLKEEFEDIFKNNIKLNAIGELDDLPIDVKKQLDNIIEDTKDNSGMVLTLALSYGGKQEIFKAVKEISKKVKNDMICLDNFDDSVINDHLYTRNLPNVDLLIRTSGEKRISNFLLWQIAYAELYFCDVYWPDFSEDDFTKAVIEFQNRERRFGKTSKQL